MSDYDYWDIHTGEGLSDYELHKQYDEYLYSYGEDAFPGFPYDYSRVLKEVDPIAYRCGFNDWVDAEIGETITEDEPEDDDSDEDDEA